MEIILIVDDQKEDRELIEVTLNAVNRLIFQAENGRDAIQMAIEKRPHLIIMDIGLPGEVDGIEATRCIKKHPETKDCKIILLTAQVERSFRHLGYEAGADSFFLKPFSPTELMERVDKVLNGSAAI